MCPILPWGVAARIFARMCKKYTFSRYMCTVLLSFLKIWAENKAKVFEAKKLHFNWENKQFRLPVTGNTHFCGKSALFCLELITFTRKMSETFFFEAFSSQKWLFCILKPKRGHLCRIFGYMWMAPPRVAVQVGGGKMCIFHWKNE